MEAEQIIVCANLIGDNGNVTICQMKQILKRSEKTIGWHNVPYIQALNTYNENKKHSNYVNRNKQTQNYNQNCQMG